MLTLALRLGMTLQDLRERMSAEELFLWMAYNEESPLSDARGDIQASIIAASTLQAQGAKVTAMDLLPQWKVEKPAVERAPEEGEELFKAFLMASAEK
ncbi:phage tail assembly protein T [Pseudomonas tussilaginis]|uniref:phage tail assembly protein T n=1 Tax=Pseudomonas putida TaxID=303 RepID=UPI000FA410CE